MINVSELKGGQLAPPSPTSVASPGAALWLKMRLAQSLLNTAAQRFWTHPGLPCSFPLFLGELYSIVSCSVPLMEAASERALQLASSSPLAAVTAHYLQQHIEEERHHDEWLLDDLVDAGMDRAELLQRPASANVARLIGAQYCWIHHAHPAALFGYLGVIEGNPPLPEHLEEIRLQVGYPAEAFRCMHLHASDDIEHVRGLKATITALPLSESEEHLIAMSAFATLEGVIRLFEDLTADSQMPQPAGAM
jgi:hypothetical protein